MISMFDQKETWTTSDGIALKIKKMEPEHVKNVIAYLRRNYLRVADAEAEAKLEVSLLDGSWGHGLGYAWAGDARRWLENTPLMQELLRVDARNDRRIAEKYGVTPPVSTKRRREVAEVIWETSRVDEGTISALGAEKVAWTLAARGMIR